MAGVVEDVDSDDGGEYVPEEDEHFQKLTTEDAQDGDPWNGLSVKRGSAEIEGSNVLDQAKAAKRARKALERQKAVEDDWSRMNEGGKPAANILDFSKLRKKQQKKKKREDKNKVKKVTVSNLLRGIGSVNSAARAPSNMKESARGSKERPGISEAALSAAKAAKGMEKVVVKEVVKFANMVTEISRTVEAGTSAEGARGQQAGTGSGSHQKQSALDTLLNGLKGPNNVSTVEKTSYDWDKYKEEQGIAEDVEQYTKNGYLTKKDFLNRVDHRQFEMEKKERERERIKRDADAARAKRSKG
jgi:hypothetical protein